MRGIKSMVASVQVGGEPDGASGEVVTIGDTSTVADPAPSSALSFIFFDTTELYNQYKLTDNSWPLVKKLVDLGAATVATSSVTIQEVVNQWRRDALADVTALESKRASLRKKIGRDPIDGHPAPVVDVDIEADRIEALLRENLLRHGVKVVEAEPPPFEETLRRNLRQELPFKANEKGWRDFVIWWTFVKWAAAEVPKTADLYLVSNNLEDFSEDREVIAPHLQKDLDAVAVTGVLLKPKLRDLASDLLREVEDADSVTDESKDETRNDGQEKGATEEAARPEEIAPSIGAPITEETGAPQDESAVEADPDEVADAAAVLNARLGLSLQKVADALVGNPIGWSTESAVDLAVMRSAAPQELEAGTIESATVDPSTVEVDVLEYLDETTHLWTVRATVELLVEGYVPKGSVAALPASIQVLDYDWNSHLAEIEFYVTAEVEADVRVESDESPYVEVLSLVEVVTELRATPLTMGDLVTVPRPRTDDFLVRYRNRTETVGTIAPSRGGYRAQHRRVGNSNWFPTVDEALRYIHDLD